MSKPRVALQVFGSLSYRNILRFVRMEKDELKRVLETLIARGDLRVEKGARGGDVFSVQ